MKQRLFGITRLDIQPASQCCGAAVTLDRQDGLVGTCDITGQSEHRGADSDTLAETSIRIDDEAELAAQIDPDEAAAIEDARWASAVEARCARSRAPGDGCSQAEVVVLVFNRDKREWEDAVLASLPALRASAQGLNLKPEWATGAKVLVPHVGVAEEARIELKRWHTNVWARDVDVVRSVAGRARPAGATASHFRT